MQPRSFGTHDGSFHADEVTACALLLLEDLIDKDKIFRSRDVKILNKCEYVCDVAGEYSPDAKRFDHHQQEYKGELSSAGMILLYLKEKKFITDYFYNFLNSSLVKGVDEHDNGKAFTQDGVCTFSNIISNFLPVDYNSNAKDRYQAFLEAVDFTFKHLKRLRNRYLYTMDCKDKVKVAMQKNQKYLEFEEPIPWMDNFFELDGERHPALFVIMPTGSHWKLRGIPPNRKDRMKVRRPMPNSWAGLRDHDLMKISGVEGAIFCHKGRFISIWENKKNAFCAMNKILKNEHI